MVFLWESPVLPGARPCRGRRLPPGRHRSGQAAAAGAGAAQDGRAAEWAGSDLDAVEDDADGRCIDHVGSCCVCEDVHI